MDQTRLEYLFSKYTSGTATPEELAEFSEMAQHPMHAEALMALIDRLFHASDGAAQLPETAIQAALANITRPAGLAEPAAPGTAPRVRRLPYRWWAAAAIALLLGAGAYYWWRPGGKPGMVTAPVVKTAPAAGQATLTLADGSVVTLDSTGNRVMRQGNTAVRQVKGQLQYEVQGGQATVSYNTLATPPGGQFRVSLPDGTQVWLNAASTLRYPTAFTGSERKVEVSGEAYFEVAAGANMPFRVVTAHQLVEVLGTRFNINAYTNEASTRTTLLEGSVQVSGPGTGTFKPVVLRPGQQAVTANSGNAAIAVTQVQTADVIAWKDGFFLLDNTDIGAIMRQLERWYNVSVQYEGDMPDVHYTGPIRRSTPLARVIAMLEQTGEARFRLVKARQAGEKDILIVLK